MNKLTKISIWIFIATFFIQITVSNHMTTKTTELNKLQEEAVNVQNQISVINQDIYLASSITGMETKAHQEGFTPMSDTVKSISNPTIASAF